MQPPTHLHKFSPEYNSSRKKARSRLESTQYRPIRILSVFLKVIEKHYETSMIDYANSILSKYISECRKVYSYQHVILRLTEECRKQL